MTTTVDEFELVDALQPGAQQESCGDDVVSLADSEEPDAPGAAESKDLNDNSSTTPHLLTLENVQLMAPESAVHCRVSVDDLIVDAKEPDAEDSSDLSKSAWTESELLEDDIRYAQKVVPSVEQRVETLTLNLLVAGPRGAGKTTIMKNLFMAALENPKLELADSSGVAWESWSPESTRTTFPPVKDDERHVSYVYTVHDTPPLDTACNTQTNHLLEYIKACDMEFYKQEADLTRPRDEIIDTRIDAVLFVMPPCKPSAADVAFMRRVGAAVALVPIIGKADCLTPEEVEEIRDLLRNELRMGSDADARSPVFEFPNDVLRAAGVKRAVPPFAVVASTTIDEAVHPYWAVRRYRWGTVEAMRERDSDMKYLRKLLLEHGFWTLRAATDARYRASVPRLAALNKPAKSAPTPITPAIATPAPLASSPPPVPLGGIIPLTVRDSVSSQTLLFPEVTFDESQHVKAQIHDVQRMSTASAYRLTLSTEASRKLLTLRIGLTEGCCLSAALKDIVQERPTTYDLWSQCMKLSNHSLKRVVITDCQNTIFYARMHFCGTDVDGSRRDDGCVTADIDARPSDALNMALRFSAPVFVAKDVFEKFGKSK